MCQQTQEIQVIFLKFSKEIYKDENGERYVLDAMGNRMYIKVDQNGQMYYVDENGVTVMIPFGGKIKKEGWMVIFVYFFIFERN
jgi:hypothetical protein